MRAAFLFVALGLILGLTASVQAADKEVTLKGKITCAKCDLGKEAKCTTVIVVKDGDKEVIYYLDAKSGKDNHKAICQASMPGSVTGIVSEKDGKKIITASKGGVKFE